MKGRGFSREGAYQSTVEFAVVDEAVEAEAEAEEDVVPWEGACDFSSVL